MDYTKIEHKYDGFIGARLRNENMVILGIVQEIVYETDGYRHENAWAIIETGRRFNCRSLEICDWGDTKKKTFAEWQAA